MKKFTKTMLATALLVGAGAANATLVSTSTGTGNEMFLSVYDSVQAKTYNLDLNVTYGQIIADPSAALSALTSGLTLSDSSWTSFAAGITSNANVNYMLAVGDAADKSFISTGNTAITPLFDQTVTVDPAAIAISNHASEINTGLAGGNSSLINDLPATPFIGQLNHTGNPASALWGGWSQNPLAAYGGPATGLWLAGFHLTPLDDGLGNIVDTPVFTASDVTKLGSLTFTGNTLTFTAAGQTAVPLPAAVWMFGAGLMGILRANRRKSIAA